MKVLIVDKDGYLGFCEIDAGFLPYQTWEEYYPEKRMIMAISYLIYPRKER